ncbi:MAG: hypothetical protein K1X57_11260 [Gemmataceae bacterium]|nr:hypothetical protein [Gemmataceae bacterium]
MRRFFVILAGLAVIPSGLACQHTAGKCDCSPVTPPCAKYGLYTDHSAEVQKVESLPAAAPKAMPAGRN